MTRLLTLAIVFLFSAVSSQAQNWKWAQRHGGDSITIKAYGFSPLFQDRINGWNSVVDLATDPQNNIYAVSLVLSKYLDLNGTFIPGNGKSDVLLSSYTCDGTLRWSKVIGSNQDSDMAVGVRCDEVGVYVSGMTNSSFASGSTGCHFSSDTVTGNTNRNIYVAKWDLNGKFLWLRMPQPDSIGLQNANASALIDMDANSDGDTLFLFCYLTPGTYGGGRYNVTTTGTYVLKYSSTGAFAGAVALPYQKTAGYPNVELYMTRWTYNQPLSQFIATGRAYVTLQKNLSIGGLPLPRGSAYLACFNAFSGTLNYLLQDTNAYTTQLLRKVAVDQKGDIYLSGNADTNAIFNGQRFPNPLRFSTPGTTYLAGYTPFVMKIDGKTGTQLWTSRSQATSAFGLNICLRKKELLLTGEYEGTLSFPAASISNNVATDTADAFIAYLDTSTGAVKRLSSLKARRPLPLLFNTVVLDRKGSFICGGSFNDSLQLGNTILVETHPAKAVPGTEKRSDAWIGKLGFSNCNCSVAANYKIVSNVGLTSFVAYTGSTKIDSLVWSWGDGTQTTYKNSFTATISHNYPAAGHYQICVTAYNDTCSDSKYCAVLPLSTGSMLPAGVSVYPNPVTKELLIEGLAGGSVRILSITGQTLLETAILIVKQSISVEALPSGYYMLLLTDKSGLSGQKSFIKE